jgi:hypothetical protein
MVADLCNGAKHAILDRRWHDEHVEILALSVGNPATGAIQKFVSSPRGHVDVNDFATAAINEWHEYLDSHGL